MKSGVIIVNKPAGFTSFDVIAKMRGILKERRLGHSGTLDPMATGVLPVFVGKATKACDILPENEKSYRAGFVLGFSTDTQDTTGAITQTSDKKATEKEVLSALESFRGKIMQLPPMYSAVQVGGKRLYDLARQGIEVERTPREIEIYDIKLEEFDEATQSGRLFISCSKGTYIRTIIHDLGLKLEALGTMSALERTSSQGFGLEESLTLDEIQTLADEGGIDDIIKPIDECFKVYPKIVLSDKQEAMYKNGIKLDAKRVSGAKGTGIYRVYGSRFLGLCEIKEGEDIIRIYKNFW